MDDGLGVGGGGEGSAWLRDRGREGQEHGTYQCSSRGDLCPSSGTHHHMDLAILAHNDRRTHRREWLLPCGPWEGTKRLVSCLSGNQLPPNTNPLAQNPHPAPGSMKLAGEGDTPNWLVKLGELKSSISLLNRIPLTWEMTLEPKLQMDRVKCYAHPSAALLGLYPPTPAQALSLGGPPRWGILFLPQKWKAPWGIRRQPLAPCPWHCATRSLTVPTRG